MSPAEELRFDADGFVDMGAFADDGTDLDPDALAELRDVLLSDPVVEPDEATWDQLLDGALEAAADDGPFALDAAPAVADDLPGDDLAAWLDTAADLDDEGAPDAPDDVEDDPLDDAPDVDHVDPLDALDLDLEPGPLDADTFDDLAGGDLGAEDAPDADLDLGDGS